MEIDGIPLHPLVVHGVVVFAPLAAALVALFAVVPRWRWLTRWPAVATAVLSLVMAYAAKLTGEDLLEQRPALAQLVETHQDRGDLLVWVLVVFAALSLFGTWTLSGSSPFPSERGALKSRVPVLEKVLPVVLVIAAVAVVVQVILTGHSGSVAVWRL